MATYSKETALYDTGAIAGDISEAGNTATRYITAVDQNGIKVHAQNNTSSNYAQINANGMEVFKGGTSVALYGDTARVGAAASPNVTTSSTGVKVSKDANNYANVTSSGLEVYKGGSSVASFGDTARIGKTSSGHTTIQASGMQVYGNDGTVELANIGYGSGNNASGGTSNAPYYTLGQRKSGSSIGNYSVAEGVNVTASAIGSHAEGYVGNANSGSGIIASDLGAHAEGEAQGGYSIIASGAGAHAEGVAQYGDSEASGTGSHVEGSRCTASGFAAHAEGNHTTASGDDSHAEGMDTTASGTYSHAEGLSTLANKPCAHAEGEHTYARGEDSHAEGYYTQADGDMSHAGGEFTIANGEAQTVIGKFNVADNSSLFIIGNGDAYVRSNAFRVNSDGDIFPSGGQYLLNGKNIYSRNSGDTAWFSMLACTANNNTNLGYGGWDNSVGATGIYGNAINVYSKGNLDITATQTSMSGTLKVQGHDSAIGTRTTGNSSKNIASGSTLVALSSKISLTAGTWLLLGGVEFPANATGVRRAAWYDGGGSSYSASIIQVPSAGSGYNTRIETVCTVTISSSLDMYIYCGQNSGSTLTVSYSYQVVRIA